MSMLNSQIGEMLQAHPVADLFPMLADDELVELAADIAERGLLQAIVLDSEGRILDGRNRLAACHMAGLEPRFETYDGDDPDGYALAVNGGRRDLTKSKRAMIAAKSSKLERFGDQSELARILQVPKSRISEAMTVFKHAPDLVDSVVSGATSLDGAYDTARERKRAAESTESQMLKLRCDAPDLADLVTEERMSLGDAMAAMREREAQRESELRAARTNLRSVLTYLTSSSIPADQLAEQEYGEVIAEFDPSELRYAAEAMAAIANRRNGHATS